jgi:crotonobetainyl-CoA:carnitine CoA-transferase CaiB-like acyl-CoA transferase
LSVPNQLFPAADGSVVIIAPTDEMWQRCAAALDAETLDLPQYRTMRDRQRLRSDVVAAISAVTQRMTSAELIERLGAVKVNIAKVQNIGEAADHPQLVQVGGVVQFEMDGRPMKAVASPFALEGTPMRVDRPPPALGADTDEILADLGFSSGDVAALRNQGAFGARSEAP